MSLYDEASLVMIPSGYKEDKLYSIKPTSGDGDFTFSRGTDTATRVNASGLIEKERGNLLLQSNSFDTTWLPSSAISATGGQSGYDGSSDAWLLKRSDSAARYLSQNITLGSAVHTYSVYAKAESENWLYIWSYDGSVSVNAYFDLSGSGAVGTTSGLIDANIESVENGWFRCSITYNDNISSVRLYPAVADGSITGGITDAGIYIQDAQLEQGLVATDYIETTTAAVYEGITDNLPRLDYSGGASCPSLLLEPQRTNVLTQSEYTDSYGKNQTPVITENAHTSPEGVQNAINLNIDSTSEGFFVFPTSVTSGDSWTISVFVKYIDGSQTIKFGHAGTGFGGDNNNVFNVSTGSVVTESGGSCSVEDYGNGWYRLIATRTAAASSTGGLILYGNDNTDSNFAVYGFQMEEGSYATSYIPTYGTSATRAKDSCIKTGISSLIGQTEGTLFLDFKLPKISTPQNHTWVALKDSAQNNRIMVYFLANSETLRAQIKASGTAYNFNLGAISNGDRIKIAIAYKSGDSAIYVNGSSSATSTIALTFGTMDIVDFTDSSSPFEGDANEMLVFPTRLTNAELASLTTL